MSSWTENDRRIGLWSATAVVAIGVIYVLTGLIGVLARPPTPILLKQVDPYLAVLETLIILSTVPLVAMQAAVYAYAAPDRKTYGLVALAFMVAFAVLTDGVHFAALTVGRQVKAEAMPQLLQQLSFDWPTVSLALDLLAWDFLLGLSLLFAASVFRGDGLRAHVRRTMILAGTLCLAGTLGPLLGNLRIQFLGIAGYAFVLPIGCALVAVLFRREGREQVARSIQ